MWKSKYSNKTSFSWCHWKHPQNIMKLKITKQFFQAGKLKRLFTVYFTTQHVVCRIFYNISVAGDRKYLQFTNKVNRFFG